MNVSRSPSRHRWPPVARIDATDLTWAGGAMLALAFILPELPVHPGTICPLRLVTGVPCPMCGMTTSVEATVHLHLGDAFGVNPVGILAVIVAIALLVRRPATVPVWRPGIVAGLGAMWLFELHRFAFL